MQFEFEGILSSELLHPVVSWKLSDVSEMLTTVIIGARIFLMIEAVNISETSVYFKRRHSATCQKTVIFILADVRRQNLTI
jgi:hypothetical protein